MIKLTAKEKKILKVFGKAIPKMSETEKERLLMFGEALGLICDETARRNTGQVDIDQKPA